MIDRVPRMAASRLPVPSMAMAMAMAMALLLLLVAGAGAQSSSNCTAETSSLSPCLTYILGSDPSPSALCCSAISVLNTNNPGCLCQVVAQFNSTAYVNVTKAYDLPGACGIAADAAACPALAPTLAPALAPSASMAPTPPLSPPPPALANATSPPANAAPVIRPSSALTALAALGVSILFSGFWVGAWRAFQDAT